MDYFINILREYPAITLFLTIGLGFLFGRLRYKSFTLGSVTSTLLVGIIVGQLDVPISDQLKTVFFMMFLFSIGYSVGPGFFRSLKGIGLRQALFAVAMSFSCFLVTLAISKLLSYSSGQTVGLFSGSQTCSSLIGVGSEAIQNGAGTQAAKDVELGLVPVCYAVTYVFGTLGTVIILSIFGPKFLGGLPYVKKQTEALQAEYSHNAWRDDPAYISAIREVTFRCYRIEENKFAGLMNVKAAERFLRDNGTPLFIDRIHVASTGKVMSATASSELSIGDTIVISGRTEHMTELPSIIGPETIDPMLINFPVKQAPVLLRNREIVGKPLSHLLSQKWMHGALVKEVLREGTPIEIEPTDILRSGDLITIVGPRKNLNRAADRLGHMDRPTTHTDIMFLMLAIFIGGIIGTFTIMFDKVPVSFGTSGGSLIAGLVFGWLRSKRPTYGHIPKSVLWFLNQFGLNAFIAVVGINCAPTFVEGIKSVGWLLPVVGAVATTIPLIVGLWLGKRVFKFNPAFTLGCCAGTRTCTAALGAVQDVLGSNMPTVAYTVTYAVSNILLIIWGLLAVILT